MTLTSENLGEIDQQESNIDDIKELRYIIECRVCHEKIKIKFLKKELEATPCFPMPHIIIHGEPAHAMCVFIDANGKLRDKFETRSIQVGDVVLNQQFRSNLISKLWQSMKSWTKL